MCVYNGAAVQTTNFVALKINTIAHTHTHARTHYIYAHACVRTHVHIHHTLCQGFLNLFVLKKKLKYRSKAFEVYEQGAIKSSSLAADDQPSGGRYSCEKRFSRNR